MVAAMRLLVLAALGLLLLAGWWGPMTVMAASVSLLLVVLFPEAAANAWLIAPVAIIGLIVGVVWFSWPSREVFGG